MAEARFSPTRPEAISDGVIAVTLIYVTPLPRPE
jgi:hypothetical protein